jgi:hypothetical protein
MPSAVLQVEVPVSWCLPQRGARKLLDCQRLKSALRKPYAQHRMKAASGWEAVAGSMVWVNPGKVWIEDVALMCGLLPIAIGQCSLLPCLNYNK